MKVNAWWFPLLVGTTLLFTACGHFNEAIPATSPEAAAKIDSLLMMNQGLADIKGLGRMKLVLATQKQSSRMAWAGSMPDKLRMDFMGAPGVTLATLASDGRWVYLRLDQENRFYKKESGRALFRGMVDIPISVREALQILGGKIPLAPHKSAVIVNKDSKPPTLVLNDRWGNVCQRIFFDTTQKEVTGFEMVRPDGSIAYRTEFQEMMNLKQFKLPKLLVLSNSKGERFELKVERYWINQPLPMSRYVLQPLG